MHVRALLLVLVLAAAMIAGVSSARGNHGYVMPFDTFQPRGWDKFHDSNRLLRSKCREPFDGMSDFAGKPLGDVLRVWRHVKLDRLRAKRERVRDRSSLCWPAHHSLWLCIHSGEGDWEDGGWPYWGGLQMGAWFLETFMGITNPQGVVGANGWYNAPTQYAQEAAAERAYRQNHSVAFLRGQWPRSSYGCEAFM